MSIDLTTAVLGIFLVLGVALAVMSVNYNHNKKIRELKEKELLEAMQRTDLAEKNNELSQQKLDLARTVAGHDSLPFNDKLIYVNESIMRGNHDYETFMKILKQYFNAEEISRVTIEGDPYRICFKIPPTDYINRMDVYVNCRITNVPQGATWSKGPTGDQMVNDIVVYSAKGDDIKPNNLQNRLVDAELGSILIEVPGLYTYVTHGTHLAPKRVVPVKHIKVPNMSCSLKQLAQRAASGNQCVLTIGPSQVGKSFVVNQILPQLLPGYTFVKLEFSTLIDPDDLKDFIVALEGHRNNSDPDKGDRIIVMCEQFEFKKLDEHYPAAMASFLELLTDPGLRTTKNVTFLMSTHEQWKDLPPAIQTRCVEPVVFKLLTKNEAIEYADRTFNKDMYDRLQGKDFYDGMNYPQIRALYARKTGTLPEIIIPE